VPEIDLRGIKRGGGARAMCQKFEVPDFHVLCSMLTVGFASFSFTRDGAGFASRPMSRPLLLLLLRDAGSLGWR
jgi:hypothetical protein